MLAPLAAMLAPTEAARTLVWALEGHGTTYSSKRKLKRGGSAAFLLTGGVRDRLWGGWRRRPQKIRQAGPSACRSSIGFCGRGRLPQGADPAEAAGCPSPPLGVAQCPKPHKTRRPSTSATCGRALLLCAARIGRGGPSSYAAVEVGVLSTKRHF